MVISAFYLFLLASNGDCGGNIVPETDSESVIPRASSSIMPKMKSVAYSDVSEVDSGILGHVMSRMPSGPFPMGGLPLAGDHTAIFGGQMISPTHPQGPVHFLPPQVRHATTFLSSSPLLYLLFAVYIAHTA